MNCFWQESSLVFDVQIMLSISQSQRVLAAFQSFFQVPLATKLQSAVTSDAKAIAVNLFQAMVNRVPAYQAFLQEQGIEPQSIQSFDDFQTLPLITKNNYLQRYPLKDRCWDGVLESCDLIAVSSGSTGKPTFWPRFITDELQIASRFEQIFLDSFQADQQRTLAVVCFPMGTWVGGLFTTNCCRHLAAKGYPLTIIAPGNHKTEILRVIRDLGSDFEQLVLLGYPPFIKDVIDTGIIENIPWANYQVKGVFAGEVFSEEWRSLVGNRLGSTNFIYDFASLYGTADAGVLGNETPLSITIRRFLAQQPDIARELFGESRLPTLVQYDPTHRFFEVEDGTLLFSGDNGIPLIRYYIADNGGIIPYLEMLDFLRKHGFDPLAHLQNQRGIYPLPFVYVFGRSQFTLSYFGANIYPENIAVGLEQTDIQDWVTGKFVMEILEDTDHNPHLAIAVELAPNIKADNEKVAKIAHSIQTQLIRLNSEFANYVPARSQSPQISLWSMGDPTYFPIGVKHRYTR
jgi:phenylacetate-CoA ligase